MPLQEGTYTIEIVDDRKEKGGQHVGCRYYPVKVTHIDTGITAICHSDRSQHVTARIAKEMVEYALLELGYLK